MMQVGSLSCDVVVNWPSSVGKKDFLLSLLIYDWNNINEIISLSILILMPQISSWVGDVGTSRASRSFRENPGKEGSTIEINVNININGSNEKYPASGNSLTSKF